MKIIACLWFVSCGAIAARALPSPQTLGSDLSWEFHDATIDTHAGYELLDIGDINGDRISDLAAACPVGSGLISINTRPSILTLSGKTGKLIGRISGPYAVEDSRRFALATCTLSWGGGAALVVTAGPGDPFLSAKPGSLGVYSIREGERLFEGTPLRGSHSFGADAATLDGDLSTAVISDPLTLRPGPTNATQVAVLYTVKDSRLSAVDIEVPAEIMSFGDVLCPLASSSYSGRLAVLAACSVRVGEERRAAIALVSLEQKKIVHLMQFEALCGAGVLSCASRASSQNVYGQEVVIGCHGRSPTARNGFLLVAGVGAESYSIVTPIEDEGRFGAALDLMHDVTADGRDEIVVGAPGTVDNGYVVVLDSTANEEIMRISHSNASRAFGADVLVQRDESHGARIIVSDPLHRSGGRIYCYAVRRQ